MFNETIFKLREENEYEKELLNKFLEDIKTLPIGGVHVKIINGYECYYHYIPSNSVGVAGKCVYIRKGDTQLLSALCRRGFLEKSIKSLKYSIKQREKYLKYGRPYDPNSIMSKLPKPCFNLCYLPILKSGSKNVSDWISESFEKSALYPEQLIYTTPNGIKVRSKSELFIASELELSGVPYRYEAALALEGRRFYPDFTILSLKDGRVIYWEHFGKPDDPVYAESMNEKLSVYRRNKIVPFHNLIETYEMPGFPFDSHLVRRIIKSFLIP